MATLEAPARPQTRLHEGPFVNEPLTDFSKEENARKMRAAIEKVRGQLGREYDLIIGGKRVKTQEKITPSSRPTPRRPPPTPPPSAGRDSATRSTSSRRRRR